MKCKKCRKKDVVHIWGSKYCPACIEKDAGFKNLLSHRSIQGKVSLKSSAAIILSFLAVTFFGFLFYFVFLFLSANIDSFSRGVMFLHSINMSVFVAGIVLAYVDSGKAFEDIVVMTYVLMIFVVLFLFIYGASLVEIILAFGQSAILFPFILFAGVFFYKTITGIK